MNESVVARPRPRPVLVRGLAPRFALMMCDPRVAPALRMSCVEDTIEVHYPESYISCRLLRLPACGLLRCSFRVTHLAPDGSPEESHRMDLVLDGPTGSAAQREAVLHRIYAFRCAATATRLRLATRVARPDDSLHRPSARAHMVAA
ncbi:hypothetical protein AB0L14_37465 [Streptomyces sp. NPDC052727]|uniref:hypothetical protein n=1 Tax=Streptomyces sp. NPDC052727 TaxID=3154854 RepID=UPI0034150802